MAVVASTTLYVAVAQATTGGTAPGGAVAPTGCALTSPTDVGGWTTQASVPYDVAEVDATNFGGGGFEQVVAGLKSGTLGFSLNQDFGASAINQLLGINGTVAKPGDFVVVEVRPTTAARSTTNPGFVCKALHKGWKFFNGKVGDIPTVDLSLRITGGFGELVA